jgi:hypothetical protein
MSAGGDEAARQQAALQQLHQPLSVGQVRLAARDVLDVPGVAHQHLLEVPVLKESMVDRHGIDPGRLHRHVRDAQRDQPPGRLGQHPAELLELALDRLPAVRPVTGQPDRHRDHVLAHVDRRAPLIQHLHACLPGSVTGPGRACRPRSPRSKQDPDTRVRSRNRGTPEGEGSSVNLINGLAEPRRTDVGGPHARRHSH